MEMLVEDVRDKFAIKTITNIIGEPTYKAINNLREVLYANTAAIPTTSRGGGNDHDGLIMDTVVYAKLYKMDYIRPM